MHGQLHGALDRNVRHTIFFVDPAVAVELVLLINQEVAELAALIGFEHGGAIVLERFIHVRLRDHTRHRTLRSNQRTGSGHLRPLVFIEERVHADDDEINDYANDREANHKGEGAARTQVFVLVLGFVAGVAVVHHFVTHISLPMFRYPCFVTHATAPEVSGSAAR